MKPVHVYSLKERLPNAPHCPECRHRIDGATSVSEDGKEPTVKPGDLTVCLYCGSLNVYTPELNYRKATPSELGALELNPSKAELFRLMRKLAADWRRSQHRPPT